jgi:hypothetical protein
MTAYDVDTQMQIGISRYKIYKRLYIGRELSKKENRNWSWLEYEGQASWRHQLIKSLLPPRRLFSIPDSLMLATLSATCERPWNSWNAMLDTTAAASMARTACVISG